MKPVIRHIVSASLSLASTVGLAPTALSQDVDTTPPVLTFSPNPLTVVSGATVAVTFTATDNEGIERGGGVECTAGSFSVGNSTYTAPAVSEDTDAECEAVACDAAGNAGAANLTVSITAPAEPAPPPASCPDGFTESSGFPFSLGGGRADTVHRAPRQPFRVCRCTDPIGNHSFCGGCCL